MSLHTFWDHLFVVVVFFAYPFYAWRSFPSFVESVRKKGESARIAGYRETIAIWLAFSAALVVIWLRHGRAWDDLGLRWGDPLRFALGAAFGLALLWITHQQMRKLASRGASAVADQLGDVVFLIPRTRRELGWFRAVSVNAGITEELVFRGFLLWYLEPYVGLGWAAVLAVVAFTLGHAYQGVANVPALALASACFVGLYLWSGSLLLPMVVHALVDIMQGNALARCLGAPARDSGALQAMQVPGE